MFKMTKADALARQATQIEHFASYYGAWVREAVAAATHADKLPDDGEIDVVEVNRHIPRGGAVEALVCRHIGHDFGPHSTHCARCNTRKIAA